MMRNASSLRHARCLSAVLVSACLVLSSGCETLKPVEPKGAKTKAADDKVEKAKPDASAPRGPKKSAKDLARNIDSGRKQPVAGRPAPPTAPAGAPTGRAAEVKPEPVADIPIPPETDAPHAANLNDLLEKNPIDEKADSLVTTVGKISSARVTLLQANADIKPRSHTGHDVVLYVTKGKAILTIGEDRHVAAPGTVFIIPKKRTYSLVNTGEKPFVALVIEAPSGSAADAAPVKAK